MSTASQKLRFIAVTVRTALCVQNRYKAQTRALRRYPSQSLKCIAFQGLNEFPEVFLAMED